MSEMEDSEITLGTGRLLALFFGLVVICAVFFSVGFAMGRKSVPAPQATLAPPLPAPVATAPAPKPTADKPVSEAKPATGTASTSDELTFYKSVEQNDAKAKLDTPAPEVKSQPAQKPAPELPKAAPLGPGYLVQVAAVTKAEDADALVNALRKKNYPVFTTTAPTDKLFHVQVGPFPDLKDAETTRGKLVSDGYNPILKK